MRITVVGSLNYDLVTQVATVPGGGETVPAQGFATHFGGKGANQAYALRRLAARDAAEVAMVGAVGADTFGDELVAHLERAGVDVAHVARLDGERTGVATILVEADGENRIMVFPGANGRVAAADAAARLGGAARADYVVLQNEIPLETTLAVLRAARQAGTKTVFNPSPLPALALRELPPVDVLVVNAGEAAALAGQPADSRAAATAALPRLLEAAALAVVTLGSGGVVWQERGGAPGFVPAHRVRRVVDTTGAGDTFLAALVAQLLDAGASMEQRVAFAAKAAALAVTREGAAASVPTLDEVRRAGDTV